MPDLSEAGMEYDPDPAAFVFQAKAGHNIILPTKDAAAALRFCQTLAQLLAANPGFELISIGQPVVNAADSDPIYKPPDLSVVIPIYNEAENLSPLYVRLTSVLDQTKLDYELLFVDDGSNDNGPAILEQLVKIDLRVIVVQLARNFGHQVALSAGLDYSRGEAVIMMDGDLQDPPEFLPQLIAKWQEGYDVVYAIRQNRKEPGLNRFAYAVFYRLLRRVARIDIPLDAGDFCIMNRRVVDLLVSMPERNRFVRGIRSWVGLNQIGIPYERRARHAGQSKYPLSRLVYLALDGLISFSYMPLRVITGLGVAVSLVSIFMALFYLIKKFTYGLSPPGFATLTVAIFLLAGIQLITLGVIGEYVGRIFEEVKQRPLYVTRQVMRRKQYAYLDA